MTSRPITTIIPFLLFTFVCLLIVTCRYKKWHKQLNEVSTIHVGTKKLLRLYQLKQRDTELVIAAYHLRRRRRSLRKGTSPHSVRKQSDIFVGYSPLSCLATKCIKQTAGETRSPLNQTVPYSHVHPQHNTACAYTAPDIQ